MKTYSPHQTAFAVFAFVLAVVAFAALITTLHGVNPPRLASNEPPPGVSGLSQPHPPLDSSPGHAVRN
jgi:hypothetical protein